MNRDYRKQSSGACCVCHWILLAPTSALTDARGHNEKARPVSLVATGAGPRVRKSEVGKDFPG